MKKSPKACTPEAARLPVCAFVRRSTRSIACTATQSTAASPQPATLQPASRKTGSASRTTSALPSAGRRCPGSGRGVENRALGIRMLPGTGGRRRAFRRGSRARRRRARRCRLRPAAQPMRTPTPMQTSEDAEQKSACAGRIERGRRGGLHQPGENTRGDRRACNTPRCLRACGFRLTSCRSLGYPDRPSSRAPRPRQRRQRRGHLGGSATARRALRARRPEPARLPARAGRRPRRLRGRGRVARAVRRAGHASRRAFVRRRDRALRGGALRRPHSLADRDRAARVRGRARQSGGRRVRRRRRRALGARAARSAAFLRRFLDGGRLARSRRATSRPHSSRARARCRSSALPWEAEPPLDELAATPFPKLVVSGAHSAAFDAVCDVLVERLGAERAVLPGAGHSVQRLGEPFNELLAAFVERAT